MLSEYPRRIYDALAGLGRCAAKTHNIQAYSGREKFLMRVLDYWTYIFDEFTSPKRPGECNSLDVCEIVGFLQFCVLLDRTKVCVYSRFNSQTPCADDIRGYSAKELVLAHDSHYWTPPEITFTPPEMTGGRFRKKERISNQSDNGRWVLHARAVPHAQQDRPR